MTKIEILQCVAANHNQLTQIMVGGDNAIMMGEALKGLRWLANELKTDIEAEESEAQQAHTE